MSIDSTTNDYSNGFDSINTSYSSSDSVNPTTGLPMVGGVDVMGNPYGSSSTTSGVGSMSADSVNPATGLPMVGGVDVMGNPYGSSSATGYYRSMGVNPETGLKIVGYVDSAGNICRNLDLRNIESPLLKGVKIMLITLSVLFFLSVWGFLLYTAFFR